MGDITQDCAGTPCSVTEVEVYDLADFCIYERDFHMGPQFVPAAANVHSVWQIELHRQAGEMSGFFDDCPGECWCHIDPDAPVPPWGAPVNIDIFGYGVGGYVYFCRAKKRQRVFRGKCGARPPVIHVEAVKPAKARRGK